MFYLKLLLLFSLVSNSWINAADEFELENTYFQFVENGSEDEEEEESEELAA